MRFPRIYSIQAKLSIVFLLIAGVIVCSGALSVYVSKRHLSSTQLFAENIIPRIQRTNELQQTASRVKSYSRELSQATTRAGLHLVYSDLTVVLTRMEDLTATISNDDSGMDIVSLNFLSQAIRSQAQLVFQLKAQLLGLVSEQRADVGGIRRDLLELITPSLSLDHYPALENRAPMHDLLEQFVFLMEKLDKPSITLEDIDRLRVDFKAAGRLLFPPPFKDRQPNAAADVRPALDGIMEQVDRMFAAKRQSTETVKIIGRHIGTLDELTDRLIRLTERYIDGVRDGFRKNADRLLEGERVNINLMSGVLLLSIIMLFLLHRQIIVRGFGNRLSMISRAMGQGAVGGKDHRLPLKGRDEIADMARAAGELLEKAEKLRELATIDELTRVHNRRRFFQLAEKEAKRAARKQEPAVVLMLDLDHFKRINDTWGHDFGDRVLREFAGACSRVTREVDLFARYGGEEFILLMPETSSEAGSAAAKRLLATTASLGLVTDSGMRAPVTVSIGMAETPLGTEEIKEAIKKADTALYRAKKKGRNRVEVYGETASPGN